MNDFKEEEKRLYEENGVAHLLAVSGLHVSIVGGMLFRFLRNGQNGFKIILLWQTFRGDDL